MRSRARDKVSQRADQSKGVSGCQPVDVLRTCPRRVLTSGEDRGMTLHGELMESHGEAQGLSCLSEESFAFPAAGAPRASTPHFYGAPGAGAPPVRLPPSRRAQGLMDSGHTTSCRAAGIDDLEEMAQGSPVFQAMVSADGAEAVASAGGARTTCEL